MDNQKFGQFILSLRKEKGWTQLELAEKLNVTISKADPWADRIHAFQESGLSRKEWCQQSIVIYVLDIFIAVFHVQTYHGRKDLIQGRYHMVQDPV